MADGEACADGGLLSNRRATTSVASTPVAGGGGRTISAVRWCCVAVTAVVALERPPAHHDLPTRVREMTSLSVSCSRREGLEEAVVECISTMLVKLEHQERQKPPTWCVKYRSGFTTLPPALLREEPVVVLLLERA
jgi:hypothetical protein